MVGGAHRTRVKQPLAIVGASTRSAAASAVRAGFQPIAADLFADADLRQIATATRISPYPEGLADWLRAIEPPAWMYTGALENHPGLVDEMAWIAPLWGNPGDVLERVRSPWELSSVLTSAGLLFPETRESSEGLPLDGAWLAKSYQGASGSGVRAWNEERGTRSEERGTRSEERGARSEERGARREEGGARSEEREESRCFQRRIDGAPCAAVFVAADGTARLLGVTRQLIGEAWLGALGFQYAGSVGPLPLGAATQLILAKLGDVLAAEFELVGLFGVDFMLAGEEVWTVEVNPRYTASVEVVERFSGVRAIALHAAACSFSGETQRAGPSSAPDASADASVRSSSRAHGKAILFARRGLQVSQRFFDYAMAEALRTPWPALADVSPAGTPIEAGRPICTVFADGATTNDVEGRLRHRVIELEAIVYDPG